MVNLSIDFARFADLVKVSDARALLADSALLLSDSDSVTQHWAPFDYTPRTARLAIVGITPGREQACSALRAFGEALRAGHDIEAALRHAKLVGSFSGAMRGNIVSMLDAIGLQKTFGIASCADLFDPAHEQVHFASALRYPVFVRGANYNGTPDMLRTPALCETVETCLAAEARMLSDAVWLPLGPKPAAGLRHLVAKGVLPANRVLEGMPHPSGANAERIKFFLGLKHRTQLSIKTRPDLIELARETLLAQVARLGVA